MWTKDSKMPVPFWREIKMVKVATWSCGGPTAFPLSLSHPLIYSLLVSSHLTRVVNRGTVSEDIRIGPLSYVCTRISGSPSRYRARVRLYLTTRHAAPFGSR
jgi:hypothetical protein